MDPETKKPVPRDGQTIGEVVMRGNIVMKGYLKNPAATEKAFEGGAFVEKFRCAATGLQQTRKPSETHRTHAKSTDPCGNVQGMCLQTC